MQSYSKNYMWTILPHIHRGNATFFVHGHPTGFTFRMRWTIQILYGGKWYSRYKFVYLLVVFNLQTFLSTRRLHVLQAKYKYYCCGIRCSIEVKTNIITFSNVCIFIIDMLHWGLIAFASPLHPDYSDRNKGITHSRVTWRWSLWGNSRLR